MSKLFKQKQWLTVEDAAKRLSIDFDENVSKADVYRLALDGKLTLSVYFVNGVQGRPCLLIPIDEATDEEVVFPGHETVGLHSSSRIRTDGVESHVLHLAETVTRLKGVWDLPMIGGERIQVERIYQQLTGGPDATNVRIAGAFVRSIDGQLCQLLCHCEMDEYVTDVTGAMASLERIERYIKDEQIATVEAEELINQNRRDINEFLFESESQSQTQCYFPREDFPEDIVFVVKTDALLALEKTANNEQDSADKPLGTRERDTLLTIIAAMATKGLKLKINEPGKAALLIAGLTDELGVPVSKRTIEDHLKKIANALGTRMK